MTWRDSPAEPGSQLSWEIQELTSQQSGCLGLTRLRVAGSVVEFCVETLIFATHLLQLYITNDTVWYHVSRDIIVSVELTTHLYHSSYHPPLHQARQLTPSLLILLLLVLLPSPVQLHHGLLQSHPAPQSSLIDRRLRPRQQEGLQGGADQRL